MLNQAIKMASKSIHKRYKHGVIVSKGGAILSKGFNHNKTHAEYHALTKLWPNKREGTTVWSIRVTPGGKLSCAKPCKNCSKLLVENKVKKVIYSKHDGSLETMMLTNAAIV